MACKARGAGKANFPAVQPRLHWPRRIVLSQMPSALRSSDWKRAPRCFSNPFCRIKPLLAVFLPSPYPPGPSCLLLLGGLQVLLERVPPWPFVGLVPLEGTEATRGRAGSSVLSTVERTPLTWQGRCPWL